jgi:hypothetical protein
VHPTDDLFGADPSAIHTFPYTPDAGRTVALLGNTVAAYGQVWHALTSHEPHDR